MPVRTTNRRRRCRPRIACSSVCSVVDRAQTPCYDPRVFPRVLSMVLVFAVAVASVGTAVGVARQGQESSTVQGAAAHLALCPTTRNSQQVGRPQAGRQIDGRSSVPALALPGLLPAATDSLVLSGASWMVFATPSSTRLGSFAGSGRCTRGPPGCDSASIES
jgi:hypothetical protein